jgi:hypothetical protein
LKYFLIFFLFTTHICLAQDAPPQASMRCDNPTTIDKVKELIAEQRKEGFILVEGGFYELTNKVILPIMVNLEEKRIYHFIVVGQPDLDFLEVGIGHEAFGTDEVRDRIRKNRDHTYFTHFTYIPPFTGNFLYSITEEVKGRKKFCTAIYMMVKPLKMNVD